MKEGVIYLVENSIFDHFQIQTAYEPAAGSYPRTEINLTSSTMWRHLVKIFKKINKLCLLWCGLSIHELYFYAISIEKYLQQ